MRVMPTAAIQPVLTTLANFDGANGAYVGSGLLIDAAGNLYGTTLYGGGGGGGTVFEIAATASGYATDPVDLASFNGANGSTPRAGLIADAAGDLFGTTSTGGAFGDGTIFEIVKTMGVYASTPTVLASFNGADGSTPDGVLVADAAGNLYGTTSSGGANNLGTVFEIAKTAGGYAADPVTLASFGGAIGGNPGFGLTVDAAGDLFGTTNRWGLANDYGSVFEIAKTASGFASAPTVLLTFNGTDGNYPLAGIFVDAAGNLIGSADSGGTNEFGTVFEIARTAGGYASTASVLVNFDGANGEGPHGVLIADGAGNLYGTERLGGADAVFEIAKTANGYASTPVTLAGLDGWNAFGPSYALAVDASGNLYGATYGAGNAGLGSVYEITNTGFVVPAAVGIAAHATVLARYGVAYHGGGNDTFYVDATTIGDTIDGGGNSALGVQAGGTTVMGSNIIGFNQVHLMGGTTGATGYTFTANNTQDLTIVGSKGNDVITAGDASQTIDTLGQNSIVEATAATAGVRVAGVGGSTPTLEISGGGSATLNGKNGHGLLVKIDQAMLLNLGTTAFITATAVTGGTTLTAAAANQTLVSMAGGDTLIGATATNTWLDTFKGTAAGLNGDVIENFGKSDVIDITDMLPGSGIVYTASPTNGTLSFGGSSLTLQGHYSAAHFQFSSDGGAGTLVKYAA